MKKKRVPEGTWFCVPLQSAGYRLGLVARSARRGGGLFGCFFGPVFSELPAADVVDGLMASDAAGGMRFGSVQLQSGRWPVIHRDAHFLRESWPMPEFGRRDPLIGVLFACRYADDNPFEFVFKRRVHDVAGMPEDSVLGWEMVEWKVSELVE